MAQVIKYVATLELLFHAVFALAQKKHKIEYLLPPKADSISCNYLINESKADFKANIYYAILLEENDTFKLIISSRPKEKLHNKNITNDMIRYSNRCININKKYKLPVLIGHFDDLLIDPGYKLQSDGTTIHNLSLGSYHSFFIKFTLGNEVINYSYSGY